MTNFDGPAGIDYSPTTHSLIASANDVTVNFGRPDGEPFNFLSISTNGISAANVFMTQWSGVHGFPNEVKLATVKKTAAGFTIGDLYFNTGTTGSVGKVSADGTVSNVNFSILTGDGTNVDTSIQGGLYIDDSGSFGGDLIAVTGGTASEFDGGGVWRINSSGVATHITTISNSHLEGVVTLTNDVQRWGPFAGKIITGPEVFTNEFGFALPPIYAISTNGEVQSFVLGMTPEDFDIIPPNQDLYCIDFGTWQIRKVSSTLLTNYWGDLLITQEGAEGPDPAGRLFIVHWDNASTNFVVRSLLNEEHWFEHVTFAPINLPSHPE